MAAPSASPGAPAPGDDPITASLARLDGRHATTEWVQRVAALVAARDGDSTLRARAAFDECADNMDGLAFAALVLGVLEQMTGWNDDFTPHLLRLQVIVGGRR